MAVLFVILCGIVVTSGCVPETKPAQRNTEPDVEQGQDSGVDATEGEDTGSAGDTAAVDTDDGMEGADGGPDTQGSDGGSCAGGESRCSGRCVDTDTSVEHCGKCGTRCEALGEHTKVACALGDCIRRCEQGWIDEDGDWKDVEDPSGSNGCETQCSKTNGGTEICDGKDNDCDGEVDEDVRSTFYEDADGDGHGDASSVKKACSKPKGFVGNAEDCDDAKAAVHPGAEEVCDGKIDHDCDMQVDEKCPCTNGDTQKCGTDKGVCTTGTKTCKMGQWSTCSGNMGGAEICDGKDNDCDGQKDEGVKKKTFYYDRDGDGVGYNKPMQSCTDPGPNWAEQMGDCDDNDPTVYPGATEKCDGKDNDCDKKIDEGVTGNTYYYDRDMDGWGYNKPMTACTDPGPSWADKKGDCDDSDPSINPGASEVCDGKDNNCNNLVDEKLYQKCPTRQCRLCLRFGKRCRKQASCTNGTWEPCCY